MPLLSSGFYSLTQAFDIDCAKAAGTYDICTASEQSIVIPHGLYTKVAAVGLTSVAIQTNDTTVTTILTAGEGILASLTVGKNITHTLSVVNPFVLGTGKKIQYTVVGTGSSGTITLYLTVLKGLVV
jgi:hypothetical protein